MPVCVCVSMCAFRQEFNSEAFPDLRKEVYLQDIHCVGSLCKLYFRELPNPLLTYELYSKFTVSIIQITLTWLPGRALTSGRVSFPLRVSASKNTFPAL